MNEYLTTDADIEDLARKLFAADSTGGTLRGTYFRSLLAITQQQLGVASPRTTTPRALATLSAPERDLHLAALKEAHARCYGAVLRVLGKDQDRNRKSNFARTAFSALGAWARVGGSLLELNIKDVSKDKLRALTRERIAPAAKPVLARTISMLLKAAKELAESDPKSAASQLQTAMNELGVTMLDLGLTKIARTTSQSFKHHRPMTIEGKTMWPVAISAH